MATSDNPVVTTWTDHSHAEPSGSVFWDTCTTGRSHVRGCTISTYGNGGHDCAFIGANGPDVWPQWYGKGYADAISWAIPDGRWDANHNAETHLVATTIAAKVIQAGTPSMSDIVMTAVSQSLSVILRGDWTSTRVLPLGPGLNARHTRDSSGRGATSHIFSALALKGTVHKSWKSSPRLACFGVPRVSGRLEGKEVSGGFLQLTKMKPE